MAEYGIQIWNEAGNLIVDASTRLGRIIEAINITTSTPSSTTVPLLVEGEGFSFYVTPNIGGSPAVVISGTTVSWSFPDSFSAGVIYVGVY